MTDKELGMDLEIDINESSDIWSFRNNNKINNDSKYIIQQNKKDLSDIDILNQKVKDNLINLSKKKHVISLDSDIKYFNEEKKDLYFFKKSIEKELEIFESERKNKIKEKEYNNLLNIKMTLSEMHQGNYLFITDNDLIVNLPKNLLPNTNKDDIGNEYQITMKEIESLIPSDDIIAKMHLKLSQNNIGFNRIVLLIFLRRII